MLKEDIVRPSGHVILSLFLVSFLLPQIVVADLDAEAFRYIARRLQPNECQRIIDDREVADSSFSSKSQSSGIDCFRKLINWASNLRINRRETKILLGNRLNRIGRNDLAEWLIGTSDRRRRANQQTIEYESWDSKNGSNPTVSEVDRIYGPQKLMPGLPQGNSQQQPIPYVPDLRKLNYGKNGSIPMAVPQSRKLVTLAPENMAGELPGHHPEERVNLAGTSQPGELNDTAKAEHPVESRSGDNTKSSKIIPRLSDEKVPPCLRVPLTTALVVIGTIMILTCCCALLLRNRLAACFERFRGKKSKTKRMSADEEQGFMGPRTFGKAPKRSGRKGGGPIDVANVGIQKSNNGSNGSVRESDEPPTGCCNCCTKKKKKNKRKRSKK